jgi:hypothetical protein
VELIGATSAAAETYILGFETSPRPRMRVQWKGTAAPDWERCCGHGGKLQDDPDHPVDAGTGGDRAGAQTQGDRFAGTALSGEADGRSFYRVRVHLQKPERNDSTCPYLMMGKVLAAD